MSEREPDQRQVEAHRFEDDGHIPNNSELSLLLYRAALDTRGDLASAFEQRFAEQGWLGSWRNGIYRFAHYHSTSHEVLGVAAGRARVRFGGDKGAEVDVKAGDAVVIPAGVGHHNLASSPDFLVIGAYPDGRDWDLCRGEPGDRPRVLENIKKVPLPELDPLHGQDGPLIEHWRR